MDSKQTGWRARGMECDLAVSQWCNSHLPGSPYPMEFMLFVVSIPYGIPAMYPPRDLPTTFPCDLPACHVPMRHCGLPAIHTCSHCHVPIAMFPLPCFHSHVPIAMFPCDLPARCWWLLARWYSKEFPRMRCSSTCTPSNSQPPWAGICTLQRIARRIGPRRRNWWW